MLRLKYPKGYDLNPTEIEKGTNWISLSLKNIGNSTLKSLDVQEHSVDTYTLQTFETFYGIGSDHYLKEFKPDEEIELDFKINVLESAEVYVTIRGLNDEKYFLWESSLMNLHVSDEKARGFPPKIPVSIQLSSHPRKRDSTRYQRIYTMDGEE